MPKPVRKMKFYKVDIYAPTWTGQYRYRVRANGWHDALKLVRGRSTSNIVNR